MHTVELYTDMKYEHETKIGRWYFHTYEQRRKPYRLEITACGPMSANVNSDPVVNETRGVQFDNWV